MKPASEAPLVLRGSAARHVMPLGEGGERDVHVWWASRDVPRERQGELEALLDDTERERAARFKRDELARRFRAGRGILREILAAQLRVDPRSFHYELEERGKPFLPGSGLHFSLSDSGPLVAVAVTRMAPLGVDVERAHASRDFDSLMERVLSPRELAWCLEFTDGARVNAFYRIWTRKEALLKATGEGISRSLRAITVVGDGARGSPRVEREEGDGASWSLVDFDPAEGFAGAVALRAREVGFTTSIWPDPHSPLR